MRFAEKMLLNAKYFGLVPYIQRDRQNNRCALGLVEEYSEILTNARNLPLPGKSCVELFPWVDTTYYPMPCNCDVWYNKSVIYSIIHLFNEHVMQGGTYPEAEPWTLERLADWIDSVDPTPRDAPTAARAEEPRSEPVLAQVL